jgi:flagellar basal body P-ring protein FlgI
MMKNLKLIEGDLFEIRLKAVHVIEAGANIHRVLAGDWSYMSPYQVKVVEDLFKKAEELKDMLNHIKSRDARKDISTCFDEEAA